MAGFGSKENGVEVDAHQCSSTFEGLFFRWAAPSDTCIVDEYIKAAELLKGGGHHPLPGAFLCNVVDMPNLTVKADGVAEIEVSLFFLKINEDLLDEDGATFIMHEGVNDYESQPAGYAGDRIACGEFTEQIQ